MMSPGAPAVIDGEVFHCRTRPTSNEFTYRVSYVWFDPERPAELLGQPRWWHRSRLVPVSYRRRDYGDPERPQLGLADQARDDLTAVLGARPTGPVRVLTQLRRWGWLFNPISVFVVWADTAADPVGAVVEVTNTPWKQRHRYPVALARRDDAYHYDDQDDHHDERSYLGAVFDKQLHVSPFLELDCRYDLRLRVDEQELQLNIDVAVAGSPDPTPIVRTALRGRRRLVTQSTLVQAMGRVPLSTIRVSAGIHLQAARLFLKKVPFVPHPSKSKVGDLMNRLNRRTGLLADSPSERSRASKFGAAAARKILHTLMGRFTYERLTLTELIDGAAAVVSFGVDAATAEIDAAATIHDRRAYSAIATEGSAGLGRAFIEGWWTSDDPVGVLQVLIRNLEPWDQRRNRLTNLVTPLTDRIRRWLPADTRARNRGDISAHYDIGNDFFSIFLDETMTYSSAVYEHPGQTLAAAQRHKYDVLLQRVGATAERHLIEIGTGWGGLSMQAASAFKCRVTTTTISQEQHAETKQRITDAGLADQIILLDSDWRDLAGEFDGLVSIEMIEAVNWRDYDTFFAKIDSLLKPGGKAALQAIVLPDDRWERAKNTADFIRQFIFPNGFLPSLQAITSSVDRATSLTVEAVDDYTDDYTETLRRWRARFDERVDDVKALGFDDRFIRLWRFYLMYSEAGFIERHIHLKQITLTKP